VRYSRIVDESSRTGSRNEVDSGLVGVRNSISRGRRTSECRRHGGSQSHRRDEYSSRLVGVGGYVAAESGSLLTTRASASAERIK
jgi:hypothetical protein